MKELAFLLDLFIPGDRLLEEILHRLDVVIGGALDLLDLVGIRFIELQNDIAQAQPGRVTEPRQFSDSGLFAQVDQPLDFHVNPVVDQAILAEIGAQGGGFTSVAAIQR